MRVYILCVIWDQLRVGPLFRINCNPELAFIHLFDKAMPHFGFEAGRHKLAMRKLISPSFVKWPQCRPTSRVNRWLHKVFIIGPPPPLNIPRFEVVEIDNLNFIELVTIMFRKVWVFRGLENIEICCSQGDRSKLLIVEGGPWDLTLFCWKFLLNDYDNLTWVWEPTNISRRAHTS